MTDKTEDATVLDRCRKCKSLNVVRHPRDSEHHPNYRHCNDCGACEKVGRGKK